MKLLPWNKETPIHLASSFCTKTLSSLWAVTFPALTIAYPPERTRVPGRTGLPSWLLSLCLKIKEAPFGCHSPSPACELIDFTQQRQTGEVTLAIGA